MKIFSAKDYKTFEQVVMLNERQVKATMSQFLKKRYGEENVMENDKFIVAKGSIPIALVAHMDTVFVSPPHEVFYDMTKNVIWSPDGLGADDRAGIFAIIQILRSGLRPHIILTTDEEVGGLGAAALAEIPCPLKDLRYCIELDRRGANDCVFYDCNNLDFINYVEKFGFVENFGSFSDISLICPAWKIAGVNLSVGYMDEHSKVERLYVSHLLSTVDKVKKMLTAEDIPSFEYIAGPIYWSYSKNPLNTYWNNMESSGPIVDCVKCGKKYYEEDMFPIILFNGDIDWVCSDCAFDEKKVDWCVICGNAFEIDPKDPDLKLCPHCFEDVMNAR